MFSFVWNCPVKLPLCKPCCAPLRECADWLSVVPYWTRQPPAVGVSLIVDKAKKVKTQKFYFGGDYNGIAVNIWLAAQLSKTWAAKGQEWGDSEDAHRYFGMMTRSAQEAFKKFKANKESAKTAS